MLETQHKNPESEPDGWLLSQASHHQTAHGRRDHRFTGFRKLFIILQEISTPREELLGIDEHVPAEDMMTLEEMKAFVDTFPLTPPVALSPSRRLARYLYDRELRLIDDLLDAAS